MFTKLLVIMKILTLDEKGSYFFNLVNMCLLVNNTNYRAY